MNEAQNIPNDVFDKFKDMFAALSRHDVVRLVRLGRQELKDRYVVQKLLERAAAEGYRGLANFMAGVTWALACRAALRKSKGHEGFGKRPAAGDMWLPRELLYAVRHQVKELGWHPITAETWTTVQANLLSQASTARHSADRAERRQRVGDTFAGMVKEVRFKIPFARQTTAVRIDGRFDYGGES